MSQPEHKCDDTCDHSQDEGGRINMGIPYVRTLFLNVPTWGKQRGAGFPGLGYPHQADRIRMQIVKVLKSDNVPIPDLKRFPNGDPAIQDINVQIRVCKVKKKTQFAIIHIKQDDPFRLGITLQPGSPDELHCVISTIENIDDDDWQITCRPYMVAERDRIANTKQWADHKEIEKGVFVWTPPEPEPVEEPEATPLETVKVEMKLLSEKDGETRLRARLYDTQALAKFVEILEPAIRHEDDERCAFQLDVGGVLKDAGGVWNTLKEGELVELPVDDLKVAAWEFNDPDIFKDGGEDRWASEARWIGKLIRWPVVMQMKKTTTVHL